MGGRSGCSASGTMNLLVDTSVWVDFFNGESSSEARTLVSFLEADASIATCGVVIVEFFQGLVRATDRERLRPYFLGLDYLSPKEPDTYFEAADLFRALRRRGITVRSTLDCLIARLAVEHDVALLAKDKDFKYIVDSGLCPIILVPLT